MKYKVLQMIGIDYEKADLNIRSLFAFQPSASLEGMQVLKNKYGLDGIVIVSTCNRTEVYVSAKEEVKDLFALVCSLKKIDSEKYEKYVVERQNQDAIHHLFQLACGMKSKVFGEDQIITQVKTALLQAREAETTDAYLEKVFQGAITAAKKIKSQVHLTAVKASVIEEMKKVLEELYETPFNVKEHKEIPLQKDVSSCGIFALKNLECLLKGRPMKYSQNDINGIRTDYCNRLKKAMGKA